MRGKTKARDEIERYVLSQYGMEKQSNTEYILAIPYESDEDLECTISDEILREADILADARRCFIESDVSSLDGSERRW